MTDAVIAQGTKTKTTGRGQIMVSAPDHPNARKDGFVLHCRLVAEQKLGRQLKPQERVLHWPDEDPTNDDPDNLMVFPNQAELGKFRAAHYQAGKKAYGNRVPLAKGVQDVLDGDWKGKADSELPGASGPAKDGFLKGVDVVLEALAQAVYASKIGEDS